jgi:GEVED domain/Secretion system C-terminal sorting domain
MKKIFLLSLISLFSILANAQYCTSAATSVNDEEILNFQFSSINNTTNCTNNLAGNQCTGTGTNSFYSNFTSCSAPVFAGGTYPFSVTVGTCNTFSYNSGLKIYIDFNHDSDFVDVGEEVYFSGVNVNIACAPPTIVTGNIVIPITAAPGITRIRIVNVEGGQSSATTITPCNTYIWGETEDYSLTIIPPTPCSGIPVVGTIIANGGSLINAQPDTAVVCPTASLQLCVSGAVILSDIQYNWMKSTNGGINYDTVAGGTNLCYTIPAGTPNALYKLRGICSNTYDIAYSDSIYVKVENPTYAQIPYTQDFETWRNFCDVKDVPNDGHWSNNPANGNSSWRRNDEGSTAGWQFVASGSYIPFASTGAHSARFHSYYANNNANYFDLYLNLSTAPGNKDVLFDYKMPLSGNFLTVSWSANGGTTFTTIGTYSNISNWVTQTFTLPSNSSTVIVRFNGSTSNYNSDLAIDNIRVIPPCTGLPVAGIIPDTSACANDSFKLVTIGSSLAAGMSYLWQSAPSNAGPWSFVGTTTTNNITTLISVPTYFRCIMTCVASSLSDTTPVQFTEINSFYYCYCKNGPTSNFDALDIGCVHLLKGSVSLINNVPLSPTDTFNNPNAVNAYSNFQYSLPIQKLYKDSTYQMRLTNITQYLWSVFGSSKAFIDFNRDGNFDASESIGGGSIGGNNEVNFNFIVPNTATTGITGMRIITADVSSPGSIFNACNTFNAGEVEDYLVEIVLPPCAAPTIAGTAYITDSLMCAGYPTIVFDTNHSLINAYLGLSMQWQSSNNNVTWSNIAGANQDSLLTVVNQKTYYRLRMICSGQDTVYSNTKVVNMVPAYACYPASASFGGNLDTADNGYFTIANYNFSSGGATGPHIGNPSATRTRTDFTSSAIVELYADSEYVVSFYNILRPYYHADAKITFFIDYNKNGTYDIPAERIFTGISGTTSFYLPHTFRTPTFPVFGEPTGMRVVLNNNTLPNNASDIGVGLYTSGETEDFLVKFKAKPLALKDVANMQNVEVYPNPSNGYVFIDLEANALQQLDIIVTAVTGAEVYTQSHKNVNGKFNKSINLSGLAKGVYMIKLQSEKGTVVQKVTLQ